MNIKKLKEILNQYPEDWGVMIDGTYFDISEVRDTGKCCLSLESKDIRDMIANYEERITPEYMREYLEELDKEKNIG